MYGMLSHFAFCVTRMPRQHVSSFKITLSLAHFHSVANKLCGPIRPNLDLPCSGSESGICSYLRSAFQVFGRAREAEAEPPAADGPSGPRTCILPSCSQAHGP